MGYTPEIAMGNAKKEILQCKAGGAVNYLLHNHHIPPKLFPIFPNDNLDTLVKRYFDLFLDEGMDIIALAKTLENNRDGWTTERSMLLTTNLPTILVGAIHQIYPGFLNKHNPDMQKNLQAIFSAAPKLFSKGV